MSDAGAVSGRKARRIIAIAGGGIAGLTAALALARAGLSVVVYEKAHQPATTGAGIQISPNAHSVLAHIGLARPLRAAATAPESIEIRSGISGKILSEFELGAPFRKRYEAPYLTVHRADLLQMLVTACENTPEISLNFGQSVTDVAQHANGLTLLVTHGNRLEETQASAIIGADGIWSQMRTFLQGADTPKFTGLVAWRCLIPMDRVEPHFTRSSTGLWLGPNAHLVHYPLRRSSIMNVVAIAPSSHTDKTAKGWLSPTNFIKRDEAFEGWQPSVKQLLRTEANWGGWPIYAIKRAKVMSHGPLCLIGDAAHPMVPFAAQGGACAIEDAWVLGLECAKSPDDLASAFVRFEKSRKRRVNRVLEISRNNQTLYHMSSRLSFARDLSMKWTPQSVLQKRMRWLYSWRADD